MPADSTNIELQTIFCIETSEPGSDEVYIKYSEDGGREGRFPTTGYHSMSAGGNWSPNLILSFKESVVVSLYDNDLGHDEFLGSHTYKTADPQPETVPVSNTNGAKYELSTIPSAD
ncbi:MAG: hypothetical protein WA584_09135 [Pyrinomonadaceae bacterium]